MTTGHQILDSEGTVLDFGAASGWYALRDSFDSIDVADQAHVARHLIRTAAGLGIDTAQVPEAWQSYLDPITDREFTSERRKALSKKGLGWAMPDGSYPIENDEDLRNAIRAFGRSNPGDRAQLKRHIRAAARRLGKENLIPKNWD